MELREILTEELKEAYRLIQLMQPKSEAEFVAVVLPNLHLKIHELITPTITRDMNNTPKTKEEVNIEKHTCNSNGYEKRADIPYGSSYTDIVIIYCDVCDKIKDVQEY